MFTQFAKELFRRTDKMEKSFIPDVSSPRSKEAQQKLLELTKHGLLNVGDKVQFHYKTKEFVAQVTAEGCLLFQGENGETELFQSPSAFVNTLAKRQGSSSRGRSKPKLNLNGWEFCMVAGVSLSHLKQQLESIQQAEGTKASSFTTKVQQEDVAQGNELLVNEQSDAEEEISPLKKKQRVEKVDGVQDADMLDAVQPSQEQVADLKETMEEEKQEEESQPTESENDDNKNAKKRTTRLSSGSIKHVSYSKGAKQTSNDEASSIDPDKTDDDKELDVVLETTSSRGRRRRSSTTKRNSSRMASQTATKLSRGKLDGSSDEDERLLSRRHLRRDRPASPKVSSTQEGDDPLSNSEDNGETKQEENDELNSQTTGEEDTDDLEEPLAYVFEQLAEAERTELHCGWSKEDRESLLDALRETKQIDPSVLSQHVKGKSPEEIMEYQKILRDRLAEVTKDDELEPDSYLYSLILSLDLFHSGFVTSYVASSKKQEHTYKSTVPSDSQDKIPVNCKRISTDTDRKLKKMRKELEELRNKVEIEMASRRDLELEKQLLEVQLQEAKRATEREARKRAAIEDENEELKVRELETRRRLDRLKLKLTAIKGEPITTDGKDVSGSVTSPTCSNPLDSKKGNGEPLEEKDSVHEEQVETAEAHTPKEQRNQEEIERLEEEIDRLKSKVASLETEVSDFQQDAENERRKNHHLIEAKKYLEISLNEILHASKSSSPDEIESTTNEQTVNDLDAKDNKFHSKDVSERTVPSVYHRFPSSTIARRRKSRAFRSIII